MKIGINRLEDCQIELSSDPYEPIFTITPEHTVILHKEVYEAAKDFWKVVQNLAPENWSIKNIGEE